MRASNQGRKLTTITNAVEILEYVKSKQEIKLADISDEFNMSKSTAHGYLSTLEDCRLLEKENNRYTLGLRLLNFGEYSRNKVNDFQLMESEIERLADELGEGADFMVEEHGRMIALYNNIHRTEDPNFKVGKQFYMHNSAGGKAILAELNDSEVHNIIDRWGLPSTTDNTITNQEKLFQEIKKVRQRGYATTDEELVDGLRSIGVVLKYPDGEIFGAVGIGGPKYRLTNKRFKEKIPSILLKEVDKIENDVLSNNTISANE
jgi:DNA-binding IclR family transcriptional regulator